MNKAIKRIINKDIKSIEHNNLKEQGIYIHFNEENMLEAYAMIIGPKDSLYESGYLFFKINFPKNYPYSPPDVSYVPVNGIRIHPNLYVGGHKSGLGKVCLSIIGTWSGPQWTTIMDISTVLLSLQSILDNDPLLNEPGFHRNNKHQLKMINNYNDVIFCENIKSLIMKNYSNIPEDFLVFKDTIIDNFKNNYMKIYNNILKYKELSDRNIIINIYRINYEIKIKEIIDSYLDFCNKLNLIILNN
jgi:ubiquitin-protein ligase